MVDVCKKHKAYKYKCDHWKHQDKHKDCIVDNITIADPLYKIITHSKEGYTYEGH